MLIHIAEELHAAGPVLERAKAMVAANTVLSFVLFTLALPLALLGQQADLGTALALPAYQMLGAVVVAAVVARGATWIARLTRVEFGGGGDLFFVILFVTAGVNRHLHDVIAHAPLALAFVAARIAAKGSAVYGCERLLGTGRPAALAKGLLLVPMAGLAIGLVQTTSEVAPALGPEVAALVLASVAVFETLGPPIAAHLLRLAGEAGRAAPSDTGRADAG